MRRSVVTLMISILLMLSGCASICGSGCYGTGQPIPPAVGPFAVVQYANNVNSYEGNGCGEVYRNSWYNNPPREKTFDAWGRQLDPSEHYYQPRASNGYYRGEPVQKCMRSGSCVNPGFCETCMNPQLTQVAMSAPGGGERFVAAVTESATGTVVAMKAGNGAVPTSPEHGVNGMSEMAEGGVVPVSAQIFVPASSAAASNATMVAPAVAELAPSTIPAVGDSLMRTSSVVPVPARKLTPIQDPFRDVTNPQTMAGMAANGHIVAGTATEGIPAEIADPAYQARMRASLPFDPQLRPGEYIVSVSMGQTPGAAMSPAAIPGNAPAPVRSGVPANVVSQGNTPVGRIFR